MRESLFREMFVIGFFHIIFGFLTTRLLTKNQYPPLDDPNLKLMIFNYFLIGALSHLVFEAFGFNMHFCATNFSKVMVPAQQIVV